MEHMICANACLSLKSEPCTKPKHCRPRSVACSGWYPRTSAEDLSSLTVNLCRVRARHGGLRCIKEVRSERVNTAFYVTTHLDSRGLRANFTNQGDCTLIPGGYSGTHTSFTFPKREKISTVLWPTHDPLANSHFNLLFQQSIGP